MLTKAQPQSIFCSTRESNRGYLYVEQARTPIGASPVIKLIVELEALNSERKAHVDIQAMRALANACVDHGKKVEYS